MSRSINEQVGYEVAIKTSKTLGYLTVYRPYRKEDGTAILHRGDVASFLMNPMHQSGAWVIEIDTPNQPEVYVFRWNDEMREWESQGEVKFGMI